MTEVLERVKNYQQFIGGTFVDAADGRTAEVINPANDKVIATVPASSAEDVDRAVNAAEAGFVKTQIRDTLSRFFHQRTKRRPMILPIVMEV